MGCPKTISGAPTSAVFGPPPARGEAEESSAEGCACRPEVSTSPDDSNRRPDVTGWTGGTEGSAQAPSGVARAPEDAVRGAPEGIARGAPEDTGRGHDGPARVPSGPARAPSGPARAPEGPARAPTGSARETPEDPGGGHAGPAKATEGPGRAPEGSAWEPTGSARETPEGPAWALEGTTRGHDDSARGLGGPDIASGSDRVADDAAACRCEWGCG